ncbi:MAG: M23 family metallopeptidase [Alphaproteobacteria bacterium]|nr:M23 family metallopeptidase [Alphaproteobacteria bacterium]
MKRFYFIGSMGLLFLAISLGSAHSEAINSDETQTLATLPIANIQDALLPISVIPGRSDTLAAPYAALPIKIPPNQTPSFQLMTRLVVLPGGLIRAKLSPDWLKLDTKLFFGTIPIKIANDGEFIFAIPRDATSTAEKFSETATEEDARVGAEIGGIVDRNYPNQPPPIISSNAMDFALTLTGSSSNGHITHKIIKLIVIPRAWDVQKIDNLPNHLTNEVTAETVTKIKENAAEIRQARQIESDEMGYRQEFIWPVIGRISGIYGSQRILSGVTHAFHSGIDIAAPVGTGLCAPADGVVSLTNNAMVLTGRTLMLDHGFGLSSVFAHLSKILVKPGQKIRQGQRIAEIGKSGRVTGPHVHWGIYWHDIAVDPALLLPPLPIQATETPPNDKKENSSTAQFSCTPNDMVEK